MKYYNIDPLSVNLRSYFRAESAPVPEVSTTFDDPDFPSSFIASSRLIFAVKNLAP